MIDRNYLKEILVREAQYAHDNLFLAEKQAKKVDPTLKYVGEKTLNEIIKEYKVAYKKASDALLEIANGTF